MPGRSEEIQSEQNEKLLKWIDDTFKIAIESGVTRLDFSVVQKILFLIVNETGIDLDIEFTWNNRVPSIPGFAESMKSSIKNVKIRKKRDLEHRVIDTDSLIYFDLSNGVTLTETTDIETLPELAAATKVIRKWVDAKSSDLLMYIILFHENGLENIGF